MIIKLFFRITFFLFLFSGASAGTADKVSSWFNNMNYENTTNPGVYEGQSSRTLTLGGYSSRAPISQPFQLINVQTPKFSAGCGGIDFYAGGFSAIDSQQFIDNLRAIGQNAQSLAFMLAIQVVSPQLSDVMNRIQNFANKFNEFGMDSCDAATKLVGGAMDLMGAKDGNCTVKRMADFGEDWNTASQACTTGGQLPATENSGGEPNRVDFIKGNLAWYVLMQDPFFSADIEFAELVMNLIGTIVIENADGSSDTASTIRTILPSIEDGAKTERFNNIYTALFHGSNADDDLQIYRCASLTNDKNGCTVLSGTPATINPSWQGLYLRVSNLISSISSKVPSDAELSDMERGLISSTRIPIYRYIASASSYFPNSTIVSNSATEYKSMIAHDILLKGLTSVIENVKQRSSNLENGMSEAKRIAEFHERLNGVLSVLNVMQKDNEFTANQLLVMQERINTYEKSVLSSLSGGLASSALWGVQN